MNLFYNKLKVTHGFFRIISRSFQKPIYEWIFSNRLLCAQQSNVDKRFFFLSIMYKNKQVENYSFDKYYNA